MNIAEKCRAELQNILGFWSTKAFDSTGNKFYGRIDENNVVDANAPLGGVLYARILWSFSAAYRLNANVQYLLMAGHAYQYLVNYFLDRDFGGIYWSVQANGKPLDTKKQIYAQAFAIYGLTEYYLASRDAQALAYAKDLYEQIEKHSYDNDKAGYLEAFNRDWSAIDDLRLSEKDANEKKTMNTHLHVLEAYTNLYRIWPDKRLYSRIESLIHIFRDHIVSHQNHHLILFFDENWNPKSTIVSYGHDIEASWLLLEAAEVLQNESLIADIKKLSLAIANATMEGLDPEGGLNYEYEPDNDHLIAEKHWWVQAEAVVGFLNVYQLSKQGHFFKQYIKSWYFIEHHILDKSNGEWFWGLNSDYSLMKDEDKVGFWKCPYHNSRCCIEIIKRSVSVDSGF
jgi:mannobiose 2-epimerase